jgi:predicted kinase
LHIGNGSLVTFHKDYSQYSDIVFDQFHAEVYDWLSGATWDNTHERGAVYADATNLTSRSREKLRHIAELCGAETHLILFLNGPDAVERNRLRDADAVVPEDAMERMLKEYRDMLTVIHEEVYTSKTTIQSYSKEPDGDTSSA